MIQIDKFIEAMQEIENDKRMISKDVVVDALSEAMIKAYRKECGVADALVRVNIDDSGNLELFRQKLILKEVEDDELEMELEEAHKINQAYKENDFFEENINIASFGRAAAVLAKSVMKQKIREAEKKAVYDEYIEKLYEMVTCTVQSVEERFVVVNLGKALAVLPRAAQIPNERYFEGQKLKVVITAVNLESKGAQVLVSRADVNLIRRLFENEVSEIADGIVEIKAIARDPGSRCKMAVFSKRDDVDPIGACIGANGGRVRAISEAILGERIDIFEWSDNLVELVKNSFSPAHVVGIIEGEEKRGLIVIVNNDQLSLAIGKKGRNAKLAVKLTNQRIDIKTEDQADEELPTWRQDAELFLAKVEADLRVKELEAENKKAELEAEEKNKQAEIDALKQVEEAKKAEAEQVEKERQEAEIEKKIKKAKKSLAEKAKATNYVSKLENLADTNAKNDEKKTLTRKKKTSEEEERKLSAKELKEKLAELEAHKVKPVYSEEEMKEIEGNMDDSKWDEYTDYDEYDDDDYYDYE
ncbi:MAG: transcription termination factor NusA [Erysipelotrichaceae bacterium]